MVCKNSEMLKEAERERARIEEDKRKEQVTCIDYHILKSLVHFLSKFNLNLTCKEFFFQVLSALEELEKREEECRAAHELVLLRRFM